MSPKFWLRTFRNLVKRERPYFAHLAITHKCNLKCHFCHIPEWKVQEQDTAGMKRIIDRLDRMGIAVLSISGGGEPLIRKDFAEIINYAVSKGLQTKITSNGTMPQEKYQQLLDSRIHEIGISVDGVEGNELPFAHVGPKILETIRFLNDHLPRGKHLTLCITVSTTNVAKIDHIVSYCTREFPNARLWLNPVVVGEGQLRVLNEPKVDPEFLYRINSPTLLTPRFYKDACREYYEKQSYNWGCLAGELFFDIKPNGDFWICQDHPAKEPLNILDPDFERKYREADFSHRRACRGCTYSCYFITQKAFEPRQWTQMAGTYWWKQVTHPNEPCRETARRGWAPAMLHYAGSRLLASAGSTLRSANAGVRGVLSLVLLLSALGAMPADSQQPPAPDPDQILTHMEQRNAAQHQALQSAQQLRRYRAENPRLHREGTLLVSYRYTAPEQKDFTILERHGSDSIYKRVFEPMLLAERASAPAAARQAAEISRRNYDFHFLGLDAAEHAYVFQAEPRTRNRYLFRGKVWIDADDYAVRRVEGEPAQRPSFWVRRTHFVHEYAKFGEFWFPVRNRTEVELRLLGRSTFSIDYSEHQWQTAVDALSVHARPLFPTPDVRAIGAFWPQAAGESRRVKP